MLEECLGPELCHKLACLVLVVALVLLCTLGAPFLSSMLNMVSGGVSVLREIPSPYGWILAALLLLLIGGTIACCVRACRKCRQRARTVGAKVTPKWH